MKKLTFLFALLLSLTVTSTVEAGGPRNAAIIAAGEVAMSHPGPDTAVLTHVPIFFSHTSSFIQEVCKVEGQVWFPAAEFSICPDCFTLVNVPEPYQSNCTKGYGQLPPSQDPLGRGYKGLLFSMDCTPGQILVDTQLGELNIKAFEDTTLGEHEMDVREVNAFKCDGTKVIGNEIEIDGSVTVTAP